MYGVRKARHFIRIGAIVVLGVALTVSRLDAVTITKLDSDSGSSFIIENRDAPARITDCELKGRNVWTRGDTHHLVVYLLVSVQSEASVESFQIAIVGNHGLAAQVPLVSVLVPEKADAAVRWAGEPNGNYGQDAHTTDIALHLIWDTATKFGDPSSADVLACGIASTVTKTGAIWNDRSVLALAAAATSRTGPFNAQASRRTPAAPVERPTAIIPVTQTAARSVSAPPVSTSSGYYIGTIADRSAGRGQMTLDLSSDLSAATWTASFGAAIENNGGAVHVIDSATNSITLKLQSKDTAGCSYTATATTNGPQIDGTYTGDDRCASNGGSFSLMRSP